MSEGEDAPAILGGDRGVRTDDDPVVLPTGTVTLLFTDIEGSTRAWEHDETTMAKVVAQHDDVMRAVIESCGGSVFKTVGDAFHAVFTDAAAAVVAAAAVQRRLAEEEWPSATVLRVRCALHTGVCELRGGDYFGQTVNRVARLESIAHGGQTVMSNATCALAADRLPPDLTCVDLGRQQLKDLARPEQVWQLNVDGLPSEFPPLASLSNPMLQTNIPAETSSFLGRADELAQITTLLTQTRLLTIVGPGGVGKTRVAGHAAVELVDGSGDGVWFVDLAPLRDPQHVVPAITRAIGVRDDPARDPIAHLVDTCADRDMLIVLDSCEHLIGAVATVADALLRHCPKVSILATSREPLRIRGEQRFLLEPLAVPAGRLGATDVEALAAIPAVELFVERVRMQQPRFRLTPENAGAVSQICRALDGVPLAIELAAARTDTLSVEALARRVDEPFTVLTDGARADDPRLRTLEALIDWSWDLLDPVEQAVLRRLSVAPGSFSLDAGARLAADSRPDANSRDDHPQRPYDLDEASTAEIVTTLARKSLLRTHDDGRYALLEMIRAYATRRLADDGEDVVRTLRQKHRAIYLGLAREAAMHMPGPDQSEWVRTIEVEYDNVVAAIDRALVDGDADQGLELALTLFEYWGSSGHSAYAVGALQALVTNDAVDITPSMRCRALSDLATHEMRRGAYDASNRHCRESVALARALDDRDLLVRALTSGAFTEVGAVDDAVAFHDEALEIARGLRDDYLLARALQARQFSLSAAGRSDESVRTLEEERTVRARLGDAVGEALALSNLADEHLQRGDNAAALVHVTEALAILERESSAGAPIEASAKVEAPTRINAGWAELGREDRAAAAVQFRRALEVARRAGQLSDADYALLGLASTAGRAEDAAVLHGAFDTLIDTRSEQLQPLEAARRSAERDHLVEALGRAAFDAHYDRGRELGLAGALALALSLAT